MFRKRRPPGFLGVFRPYMTVTPAGPISVNELKKLSDRADETKSLAPMTDIRYWRFPIR